MLGPAEFRELVSGHKTGATAIAMRGLLRAAEVPYTAAVRWRNRRYDNGRATIRRAAVPVISVGNLSLGGTGKTPMVKWLARWLAQRDVRVAIVSRGYGAAHGKQNDEALELHQALPDVPHVQNANRVAGVARAVDEFGCQLILLDDGFQHRRLARDLDIVLLDALEPFGFGHVFPRGTLREPLVGLCRAHVVCLSRADTISTHELETIRRRVADIAPHAAWCELSHAPSQLINSAGQSQPLDALDNGRVAAFCGIGNPTGFRHTLTATGCEITAWQTFPDHHPYTDADISTLTKLAANSAVDLIVCTHKDLVKIALQEISGKPLWAIEIEMQFLSGQKQLEKLLAGVLK